MNDCVCGAVLRSANDCCELVSQLFLGFAVSFCILDIWR